MKHWLSILATGEQCQRRWHGIHGYCMARLRSEMTMNSLARVSGFTGRNWMKTSLLTAFLPEGDHMRLSGRLTTGWLHGNAPLNRDSARLSASSEDRHEVSFF